MPMYATACARKCAAGTMMQICWRWALELTGFNLAERCVEVFLTTPFEGGRHARRVAEMDAIEP